MTRASQESRHAVQSCSLLFLIPLYGITNQIGTNISDYQKLLFGAILDYIDDYWWWAMIKGLFRLQNYFHKYNFKNVSQIMKGKTANYSYYWF